MNLLMMSPAVVVVEAEASALEREET
jgi:hypothetical protein